MGFHSVRRKEGGTLSLLLASIVLLVSTALADFRGTIEMSDPSIEATGVTYTFALEYALSITQADSKLVIRFPHDFEEEFSVTGCSAVSGFSLTGDLSCTYLPSVRLLTIDQGFP